MQSLYSRKLSPPTRSRTSARAASYTRQRSLKRLAYWLAGLASLIFLIIWFSRSSSSSNESGGGSLFTSGSHEVVIVTTMDPKMPPTHAENIKENRRFYARKHGYTTFFPNNTDYDLMPGVPKTWSKLPATRHAMTLHPKTPWIWYLDSTALIMNPFQSLHDKILNPSTLKSEMIPDHPVVPPDSIIKTFRHLQPQNVDFILSQDAEGLASGSFLVRSGDWAQFFLDAWFDPLYRSYNFQKAEGHALEHIVQWHGTVLAKMALVPQRLFNAYTKDSRFTSGIWQEGDFVANFHGCNWDPDRSCVHEMAPYMTRWKELRDQDRHRR